jgi:hypothetical protein
MPAFDKRAQQDALGRASGLSSGEVMAELKRRGVNDLDDLVNARLGEVKKLKGGRSEGDPGGEEEAGSILIYKCFILADWD